ncbi:hypothetical protein DWB77_07538 [Streptomyces hundungensis]|uniref:Uncharacterized protein n=1 Tax=Streptomyces hundungensis TaxID=1077946 RepID=A0A387H453_9ACTN|nr:hypothetical protein DWB77_00056 [Streptomyces hundungensis]AYG85321.1 hypothetical protein DWB77_07538 [Streptomyces hundungensis]
MPIWRDDLDRRGFLSGAAYSVDGELAALNKIE